MDSRLLVLVALFCVGIEGRQLLAPDLAPSPLRDVPNVLNLSNPEVRVWARTFTRYYNLSTTLAQRPGGNKTVSYEVVFLIANAAISAAAAKNVESAINSSASQPDAVLQNAISYSTMAGSQALYVTRQPEAKIKPVLNITAYTQVAGESAIQTAEAAKSGDYTGASDAADRAVRAAQDGILTAGIGLAPAPSPLAERPY